MADEQRRAHRKRMLLDASVVFNNRFSSMQCTVRDLSATGARVAFAHATPLPAEVELEIPKTGQRFRARVMWSDGKHHGLMFLDEAGQKLATREEPRPASGDEIQGVIEKARLQIAQIAGVAPESVRLKLEIDY